MSLIRQHNLRNLIAISSILVSFCVLSAEEIPQYCKDNFPALNTRALDQEKISSYDNQTCHLSTPDNQKISVAAEDLLKFYSRTQRVEYRESVKQFREKLKEKVMRGVSRSAHDYEDLFPRMTCEFGSDPYASLASSACEDKQNFTPRCRNAEMQGVIDDENKKYTDLKLNEVHQEFEAANELRPIPDFSVESISREDQRQVRLALDRQKKLYFYKNHVKSALLLKSVLKQKVEVEERYEKEKSAATVRGPGRRHSCTSKPNQKHCVALQTIQKNYEQEKAQVELSLGVLYQQHPTVFDIQNRFEFFDWFNSEYAQSDFGKLLDKEAIKDIPELANMQNAQAIVDFLESEEGNNKLEELSTRLVDHPVSTVEEAGRKKVNEEKLKKKEAMEHLCKSDGSDLHHFDHLAKEVLNESKTNGKAHLADQAGYCYLIQTEPKRTGGLGIAALLGATVAIVGGVALQFVPVVGNLAGAGLIASAVGGFVFSYDAYDRYSAAADERSATETVYQGSNVWATPRDLFEAQDKARNQAALATAEVALSALDAALIVRPAVSLALRLGRRPVEVATVVGLVDEAPTLSLRATPNEVIKPVKLETPVVVSRKPSELVTPTRADEVPVVTPTVVQSAKSSLTAAQLKKLENFHQLTTVEKRRVADLIEQQIRASKSIDEDTFLTLMMYRGNYTPASFGPEVQDMVRAVMAADNKDEALSLLRRFFAINDKEKLSGLESTVSRLFDATTNTAVAPVLRPTNTTDIAEVVVPKADEVLRISPPERLVPITGADSLPAVTSGSKASFRITPAQKAKLDNFHKLTSVEKRKVADIIEERFINSKTLDEDAFMALIMYRGSYTPNVFTPGVQDMAHRLMMAPSKDEALKIARDFYQGKPSARSAERLKSLEDTIERLYSVRQATPELVAPSRAVTTVPAERATGTAIVPVENQTIVPAIIDRGVTSPVPISDAIRGLDLTTESIPRLARPQEALRLEDLRETASIAEEVPSVLRLTEVPSEASAVVRVPAIADTARIAEETRLATQLRNPLPLGRLAHFYNPGSEEEGPAPSPGSEPIEPTPTDLVETEVIKIHPVIENKTDAIPDGTTEITLKAKLILPEGKEQPADLKFVWTYDEVAMTGTNAGTKEELPAPTDGAATVVVPVRGDVYSVILTAITADPKYEVTATDTMQVGYDSLRTKYITVVIENHTSSPAEGAKTHKLTAKATVDGGGELPASFKFKWVYANPATLDDLVKAPEGASSFDFPLHKWSYSVAASGEAEGYTVRPSPEVELTLNCGLHGTGCPDEDKASEAPVDPVKPLPAWPEFAPVTPPARFSPAPMPQPQFYVIPGFP